MKRIKKLYANLSLSNKIAAMILLTVLIPIVSITYIFLNQLQYSIKQEVSSNYVHFVDQYAKNFDYKWSIYQNLIENLATNDQLVAILNKQDQYSFHDMIEVSNYFAGIMENDIYTQYADIYGLMVYAMNPNFPRDGKSVSNIAAFEEEYWYTLLPDTYEIEPTTVQYESVFQKKKIFSYIYPIRDNTKVLAYIKLDLDINRLMNNDPDIVNLNNPFVIRNHNHKIIMSSSRPLADMPYFQQKSNLRQVEYTSSKELLISAITPKNGWEITFLYPNNEIENRMNQVLQSVIPFSLLILVFVFIVSYFISKILMKRFKRLLIKMQRVREGNLEITDYIEGRDEIALIDSQFNIMVTRLEEVIQENYVQGLEKKKAELTLLQTQINPHFLFNTLESINSMASIIDAKEISSMSQSLGEMLRYSININDSLVMLDNELNHIVNYMKIQNIRFEDRFNLSIDVSEEAGHGKLLKLILQPIIENILLHGYKGVRGKLPIAIKAKVIKEVLFICIEDNGVGISAERLRYIENNINATYSEERSIGLRNVHLRIQLAFGQQYGLTMKSCEGVGTKVEIILPYIKG